MRNCVCWWTRSEIPFANSLYYPLTFPSSSRQFHDCLLLTRVPARPAPNRQTHQLGFSQAGGRRRSLFAAPTHDNLAPGPIRGWRRAGTRVCGLFLLGNPFTTKCVVRGMRRPRRKFKMPTFVRVQAPVATVLAAFVAERGTTHTRPSRVCTVRSALYDARTVAHMFYCSAVVIIWSGNNACGIIVAIKVKCAKIDRMHHEQDSEPARAKHVQLPSRLRWPASACS